MYGGARVADIGRDAITFEIVGRPEELDAFEELVRPHGVRELARTGRIGLKRPGADKRGRRHQSPNAKGTELMVEVIKTGDVGLLSGKVAVLGYGSQGHAHALNLADSGVDVVVGLRAGSSSRAAAEEAGLKVTDVPDAVRDAQIVSFLVPDGSQAALYRDEVAPNVRRARRCSSRTASRSTTGCVEPAATNDVIMVAPKGPGHIVRRIFEEGYGTPALIAVAQDASRQRARPRSRVRGRHRRRRAPGSSRRPSRTRPRPTSSASRPCSAAGSRS